VIKLQHQNQIIQMEQIQNQIEQEKNQIEINLNQQIKDYKLMLLSSEQQIKLLKLK
jgi:hypothetical protein